MSSATASGGGGAISIAEGSSGVGVVGVGVCVGVVDPADPAFKALAAADATGDGFPRALAAAARRLSTAPERSPVVGVVVAEKWEDTGI